jgi:hypothetical protein
MGIQDTLEEERAKAHSAFEEGTGFGAVVLGEWPNGSTRRADGSDLPSVLGAIEDWRGASLLYAVYLEREGVAIDRGMDGKVSSSIEPTRVDWRPTDSGPVHKAFIAAMSPE